MIEFKSYYFSFIKIVLFLFSHLLKHHPTILLDAILQALIPCLHAFHCLNLLCQAIGLTWLIVSRSYSSRLSSWLRLIFLRSLVLSLTWLIVSTSFSSRLSSSSSSSSSSSRLIFFRSVVLCSYNHQEMW